MARVVVPLMIGFEEIEAITVIDILRRAGVEVVTAGLSPNPILGAHGIPVLADQGLESVQAADFDGIVLPGGAGTVRLREDTRLHGLILAMVAQGKLTAAICAAPTVLSQLGLLLDKQATSYPSVRESLRVKEYLEVPVVEDGTVITSRGAGTALAFALAVAARLTTPATAKQVAQAIVLNT